MKGYNILKMSDMKGWWSGCDVPVGNESLHMTVLYNVHDQMCCVPERPRSASTRGRCASQCMEQVRPPETGASSSST